MDREQRGRNPRRVDIDGVRPARRQAILDEDDYLGIGPVPPKPSIPQKTIAFEIKVPHFTLPKLPVQQTKQYVKAHKRAVIGVLTALVLMVAISGSWAVYTHHTRAKGNGGKVIQAKPDYQPVVPLDKPNIAKTQGTDSTYDPAKHVVTYRDTYLGATFLVSQQPLPPNFKTDPKALSNLATSIGNAETLDTQAGTVYIATAVNGQQQTAIFATDKVLVFIQSPKPVDTTVWHDYINKLKV